MDHDNFLPTSRLIALEKPHGGVRRITMGKGEDAIWLAEIYALACVMYAASLLAPLQVSVGISGGAKIPGTPSGQPS